MLAGDSTRQMPTNPPIVLVTSRWPKNRNLFFTAGKLVRVLEGVAPEVSWILTEQSDKHYPEPSCRTIRIPDVYPERGYLAKAFALALHQWKVSRAVWAAKGCIFIFAFGTDYFLVPILVAKIRGRGVMLRTDGRISRVIEKYWEGSHTAFVLLYRGIERVSYGLADAILPETDGMTEFYGLERYRKKIYCGALYVDTDVFTPVKPFGDRRYDVGFVGRFSEEKGILPFIHGLRLAGPSTWRRAVVIGDGEQRQLVEQAIRDAGIEAAVDCPGWVENSTLPAYLNDIRTLVVPSVREGLPNIILEAMACGCVILAADVGGIPDVVRPETGFLLPSTAPASIAAGLRRIADSPDLDRVTANAINLIVNEYSFKSALDRYHKVYDMVKKIDQE